MQLNNVAIGNTGLTPGGATLTMPGGLGGGSVSLTNVSITKDGLVYTGSITLPDIAFGGSSSSGAFYDHLASLVPLAAQPETAPPLTLRSNQATVSVQGNAFVLTVNSTLDIALPGNAERRASLSR